MPRTQKNHMAMFGKASATTHRRSVFERIQAASKMPSNSNLGADHDAKQPHAKPDHGLDERDVLLGRGKRYSYHPGNVLFCGTIARSVLILGPNQELRSLSH
jgi:hypothetical protein